MLGYDVNGLGWQSDGRGNIAPQTIILPTVAMLVKEKYMKRLVEQAQNGLVPTDDIQQQVIVRNFLTSLEQVIEESKDTLLDRYDYIVHQPLSVAKYIYKSGGYAGFDGKSIESALKHGTLAIGQLGLAEALQILIGCDHTTEKGMELAKEIEAMFKAKTKEYTERYHLNFSVYMTPAENLCHTALKKFRERFGIIPNVSDREYFTNSMHVPVWTQISPYQKIDIESQLTGYSSGGCITVVQFDNSMRENIPEILNIIEYAMQKDIPYLAFNTPNVQCEDCGFMGNIENGECPICHSHNIRVIERVTGYLVDRDDANKGKQQEFDHRTPNNRYM